MIKPLGTPRILVSDGPTMTGLRNRLTANTSAAARFKQVIDAQMADPSRELLDDWQIALMGQVTGAAQYCTLAVSKTESYVASEEQRIANGQRPVVANDSYLHVGAYIGSMSMVYDWCRSSMTAAQRERWKNFGNQAVYNVWNPTQARWGGRLTTWDGWSINNPSNNYYYSFLEATMSLGLATYGENDMASDWLNLFRITKVENQLVPTFNSDLVGGGSREGTGYGTAMMNLWRLYDWWERSTGERLANRTPHTLASMPWMIHSVVPTLDRLIPTGDHSRDSEVLFYDYHRTFFLELATLYPDERISGVVKTLLAQSSVRQMGQHNNKVFDFLYDLTPITARPLTELSTAYYGSGTGSFSMRNDWTTTSAYANFICGPYSESHAHDDQGSFVLFKGSWLAFDANIDGHSGIEEEQRYHNTVRFETSAGRAIEQRDNNRTCGMRALANTPSWAYAMANVLPVYDANSGVTKSEREFVFIKPSTFVVYDRAEANNGIRRIFTMNYPSAPTINGATTALVRGGNRIDMTRILPANANTTVTRWSDVNPEYRPPDSGFLSPSVRVDVTDNGGGSEFLHVIGLDGSVTQAAASNAGGQAGARITLSDGRTVTVRFNQNSPGGTIEIRSAGGTVLESGALPTSVQTPPIFAN